jgi:ornithine decarboxylase
MIQTLYGEETLASIEIDGVPDQSRTPYFDALEAYINSNTISFHVPAHTKGRGTHQRFRDFVKKYGLEADTTQIMGLDDIHQPSSVIEAAQRLAADAYGSDNTYFLINGSTSGNHAMILAALNPGDKILLPRNCHKSTTGALILSGAEPVYMDPEYDEDMQVDHTITPETLEKKLEQNPDVKAVFILSPTYYGASCNIKQMVDIVHKHNKPILVDEAWGPHFHFHPALPDSAVSAGADIVVNSTHKLLGSMCQASMLHHQGNRIDKGRLESVIRLFLSTCPSCLMIASLDATRMNVALHGKELLEAALKRAEWARQEISKVPGIRTFGYDLVGRPGVQAFDGTKLTVTAKDLDFTGYEIEEVLRLQYGIQLEMSELFNALALITIGSTDEDVEKLVQAFKEVDKWNVAERSHFSQLKLFYRRKDQKLELPDWPRQVLTPREAFAAPFETIPFIESGGRICTEMITPYPPGIPMLRPGDEITDDIIDHLLVEIEAGVHIQGPADPELTTIRVVK